MGTRLNRLSEPVLTSTHNLCFRAKIRKNVYPCKPQFYYIKVGCKGLFITRTGFHDDLGKNLQIVHCRCFDHKNENITFFTLKSSVIITVYCMDVQAITFYIGYISICLTVFRFI